MANFFKRLNQTLFGKDEKIDQVSRLTQDQQRIAQQQQQAVQGRGAGGAFGESADYYRDLLSGDSQTQQQMEAPLQRQFQESIIPGLSEQFAGMGSGGLSSSGFRNAAVQAGTDLSERLGSIRAGLRQQGAQGLAGLGESSLQQQQDTLFRPETHGLAGGFAEGAGKGLGMAAAASYFPGASSAISSLTNKSQK